MNKRLFALTFGKKFDKKVYEEKIYEATVKDINGELGKIFHEQLESVVLNSSSFNKNYYLTGKINSKIDKICDRTSDLIKDLKIFFIKDGVDKIIHFKNARISWWFGHLPSFSIHISGNEIFKNDVI